MPATADPTRLRDCPGFNSYWVASTVSFFGTPITALALQLLVVDTLDASGAELGLVNGSRWVPYLLFGLVAGVFVDRSRHRPILVSTDLLRGVLLIGIPVLALTDQLGIGLLAVLIGTFGLLSLLNDAATQAVLPRLVPRRLLAAANARLDQSGSVASTSGPAVSGGLVSWLGAPVAMLVDAVSYLVCGILIARMPLVEPPARRGSMRTVLREAREGLSWAYRHATLRALSIGTHAWFLCSAVAGTVVVPFALRSLDYSAVVYGAALSVAGAGGLLGALLAVRLADRFGPGRVIIAGRAGESVAWLVTALAAHGTTGWIVFAAGQALFAFGMGTTNASEMGYRQAVTPDRLQGRVNSSMRSINRAMIVVGAPLGGLAADRWGARPTLVAAAAGFAVVAAGMAVSGVRRAREIPTEVPADPPGR